MLGSYDIFNNQDHLLSYDRILSEKCIESYVTGKVTLLEVPY